MFSVREHFEKPVKTSPSPFRVISRIVNVLIIAAIVAVASLHVSAPEPLYQGKRLSRWLAQAKSNDGAPVLPQPALVAVRQMGTNAFPSLARILTEKDSDFKRSLMKVDFIGGLTSAETRHEQALAAFRSLGPEAKGAIPVLLNLLTNADAASDSVVALTLIGPEAQVPLLFGFRALDKTSRLGILDSVGKNYFNYPANIPFLIDCLGDQDAGVRVEAAQFLGEGRGVGVLSKDSTNVVQALAKALKDTDAKVRAQATLSLSYHGVPNKAQVPAVVARRSGPEGARRTYADKGPKQSEIDTNSSSSSHSSSSVSVN